ncbi:MAG: hypothetical protein ED557_02070 [Balneola sp.]|nr:MAG: hypothetical protein ED557_02070 [Balneola sp.]
MSELYSKKEISKILSRASEIQQRKDLYGDKEGLTESELVELAAEVGIEKDSLLEALENVKLPNSKNEFNWFKGTAAVQDIQLIDGEITVQNWDQIIREVRRTTGGVGESSKQGDSFEWVQRFKEIGFRHISFTPTNGKTKVQYVYKWNGLKFMTGFFSFMFAFAIAVIAFENSTFSKTLSLPIAFAIGGIGSYLNRLYLKPYFEKKKATMHRVMDVIRTALKKQSSPEIVIEDQEVYNSEESDGININKVSTKEA